MTELPLLIATVYSRRQSGTIAPEFWRLIDALEIMAQRIQHNSAIELGQKALFSKLAGRLRTLHARAQVDPRCSIDLAKPLLDSLVQDTEPRERHWLPREAVTNLLEKSREYIALPKSYATGTAHTDSSNNSVHDDLLAISQSLIDPDFTDLDRVLNVDDVFCQQLRWKYTLRSAQTSLRRR